MQCDAEVFYFLFLKKWQISLPVNKKYRSGREQKDLFTISIH
jgi:hypothetical protein